MLYMIIPLIIFRDLGVIHFGVERAGAWLVKLKLNFAKYLELDLQPFFFFLRSPKFGERLPC